MIEYSVSSYKLPVLLTVDLAASDIGMLGHPSSPNAAYQHCAITIAFSRQQYHDPRHPIDDANLCTEAERRQRLLPSRTHRSPSAGHAHPCIGVPRSPIAPEVPATTPIAH